MKPVFVRASDRMTVAERERKAKQQKKEEVEARKEKEDRRREALKLVEDTIRSEQRNAQVNLKNQHLCPYVHIPLKWGRPARFFIHSLQTCKVFSILLLFVRKPVSILAVVMSLQPIPHRIPYTAKGLNVVLGL